MATELKVPSAGESITEVMIVEWRKNEGDFVEQDEPIVEIETDKASMEVPAPVAGKLTKVHKPAGETVAVGDVIAEFDESAQPAAAAKSQKSQQSNQADAKGQESPTKPDDDDASSDKASSEKAPSDAGEAIVMPAAQRLLAQHNLDPATIAATGPGGRLLKEDVERHLREQNGRQSDGNGKAAATRDTAAISPPTGARHEEVTPMTMLRRRIAERLVEAQQNAAMLTTFNEVDMSAVMATRSDFKEHFEKRYGVKLGFMSFFVKAAIDALKLVPAVNAEIRGNDIVYKNYYDIGVAVSTEKGLVVPVVRNAERLSFAEIEQTIGELAARARDRKLTIEELQGGTFSITNGGVFGSLMSTPILNPPQSGILGMHTIQDRPVARDGQVVIRPMMYVALTYDHRIIDGREAVTFLKRVKECVEAPSRMLLEA